MRSLYNKFVAADREIYKTMMTNSFIVCLTSMIVEWNSSLILYNPLQLRQMVQLSLPLCHSELHSSNSLLKYNNAKQMNKHSISSWLMPLTKWGCKFTKDFSQLKKFWYQLLISSDTHPFLKRAFSELGSNDKHFSVSTIASVNQNQTLS